MNLFLESLVIGFGVLVVFAVVHFVLMKLMPEQSMKHMGIFLAVFVSAICAHLLAEVFGLNKKFCDSRK